MFSCDQEKYLPCPSLLQLQSCIHPLLILPSMSFEILIFVVFESASTAAFTKSSLLLVLPCVFDQTSLTPANLITSLIASPTTRPVPSGAGSNSTLTDALFPATLNGNEA